MSSQLLGSPWIMWFSLTQWLLIIFMSTHQNTVKGSVPYSGMPNNVSAASRAPHSWLDKLLSVIFHKLLASDLFEVRSLNAVVEWLCSAFVVYFVICQLSTLDFLQCTEYPYYPTTPTRWQGCNR